MMHLLTSLSLQLCQEHGISNDGILEDFATQARGSIGRIASTYMLLSCLLPVAYPTLWLPSKVCSGHEHAQQHPCREETGKTSSSIRQTMRDSFLALS